MSIKGNPGTLPVNLYIYCQTIVLVTKDPVEIVQGNECLQSTNASAEVLFPAKCLVMTKSKGHGVLCLLKTPVYSITNDEIVTVEMYEQDIIAPLEYYSNSGTEEIEVSDID